MADGMRSIFYASTGEKARELFVGFKERVDHPDHPEDSVIQTPQRAEGHPQALVGSGAKLGKELPVVLEIDAQHLRDAEDKLPMRDRVEDIIGDVWRPFWDALW